MRTDPELMPLTSASPSHNWDIREVEGFIYREARLADDHDYDAWEALWTDDAIYWVPIGAGNDENPAADLSVIFDHRKRISTRLQQLRTGRRYAQSPPSNIRRVVSNCEIIAVTGDETRAQANFILTESRPRGIETWSGRTTYGLRWTADGGRMFFKKVQLVNGEEPLPTLGFLI